MHVECEASTLSLESDPPLIVLEQLASKLLLTHHLSLLLHLGQNSISDPKRFQTRWQSTVRTFLPSQLLFPTFKAKDQNKMNLPSLQQTFPNLNFTTPIPNCTPNMCPQFSPLSQRRQHNEIEQTPCLEFETWTCPDCAPC